jgi:hypothetical protein
MFSGAIKNVEHLFAARKGSCYLPCVTAESCRISRADKLTALPFCQTGRGSPRRACSSMTSSTASLNAISAHFSSGRLRTSLEPLFIRPPWRTINVRQFSYPLHEACASSQGRLRAMWAVESQGGKCSGFNRHLMSLPSFDFVSGPSGHRCGPEPVCWPRGRPVK